MSTETTPKKKGPLAQAVARIAQLEAKVAELTSRPVATLEATHNRYLATARVTLPALGGLALPKGVGFHAYVDVEFQDGTGEDGQPLTPSREEVTAALTSKANALHPQNIGVELCDISVLPAGW